MAARLIHVVVHMFLLFFLDDQSYIRASCDHNAAQWQPKWSTESRDDLLCSIADCPEPSPGFAKELKKRDNCCTCNSCMTWEGNEKNLFIEYKSVLGRSVVVPDKETNKSIVYKVEHTRSEMTEIPSNVCNWDNETNLTAYSHASMNEIWEQIVELDFSRNKIRKLPDINCLSRLDKLYLNHNKIEYLSNSSFNRLFRLRFLSLDGNHVSVIEPMFLTSPKLNLFDVSIRDNNLRTLDISNIFSLFPFCNIDYMGNEITDVINGNNFKLDMDKKYGPGNIVVRFLSWPNFKNLLKLDSWEQLGKLFGFSFSDAASKHKIMCDCSLQPFLSLPENVLHEMWPDFEKVTCSGPRNHAGKLIGNIPKEEFTCNISQSNGCQYPECTCVDKPKEDTIFIDCPNQNLDKLPTIPISNRSQFVSLNVSGNHIQELANMSYLSRLISLDISGNDLHGISESIAHELENCSTVDISDNPRIRALPKAFQYRDVCSTMMSNLLLDCNCDTSWLETWLSSGRCDTDGIFHCDVPEVGRITAEEFHVSDLDCSNYFWIVLGSVICAAVVTLFAASFLMYSYPYEILIILLRLRNTYSKRNTVVPVRYDVFVSFNENEEHVTRWIIQYLQPRLHESGYSTFIAAKDLDYGMERNSGVSTAIQSSRHFLIILSDGYLYKADEGIRSWTENEWKYGWYNFKQDRYRSIVLVNYDHVKATDVNHPVIRAYVRVGCTVDFENYGRNIMEDIETKLGKPIRFFDTKASDNMNKRFAGGDLFVASSNQDVNSDLG